MRHLFKKIDDWESKKYKQVPFHSQNISLK